LKYCLTFWGHFIKGSPFAAPFFVNFMLLPLGKLFTYHIVFFIYFLVVLPLEFK